MPDAATLISRLNYERYDLSKIRPEERDDAWTRRAAEVSAELQELLAIPPDDWQLPKAAAALLAHATTHGWTTATSWGTRPDGDPMVRVQFGRPRGDGFDWRYQLTWVASGSGTSMRRLSAGLQQTPAAPGWRPAPSLAAIRAVIAANPAGCAE